MATRSTIAIRRDDGSIAQIYCHWDGYLSNNGQILLDHYQDENKIEQLIALGSLSSLGPEIGEKHEFDCPHEYGTPEWAIWRDEKAKHCTAYHRDRGEDLHITVYPDDGVGYGDAFEEYNYLFDRGEWTVNGYDYDFTPLAEAIAKDAKNA